MAGRLKASATKEKIISAALSLFMERGFHATGINSILAQAGVSKGSLFHHFPTKQDIFLAVLTGYFSEYIIQPMENAFQHCKTEQDALLCYVCDIEMQYKEYAFRQGCMLGNSALELADADPVLRAAMGKMFADWRALLLGNIKQENLKIDKEEFVSLYIALIEGVTLMVKVHKQDHLSNIDFNAIKTMIKVSFHASECAMQ